MSRVQVSIARAVFHAGPSVVTNTCGSVDRKLGQGGKGVGETGRKGATRVRGCSGERESAERQTV